MTLKGLRKKGDENHVIDTDDGAVTREKEKFVSSAALKVNDAEDAFKAAKRDQSFLLKLNYYEKDLLDKAFSMSNARSKQEFVRSILIPNIEMLVNK